MRKVIIATFLFSFGIVLFFGVKHLNQPNDIDYLQSIVLKIQEYTSEYDELYYFSNNKKRELLFKTQFAFAPKRIVIKDIDEISKSEIILIIIDKKAKLSTLSIEESLIKGDSLFSDENNFYKLILLKK